MLLILLILVNIAKAQVFLGFRDNKYGFVGYRLNNIFIVAEQSVFSEKTKLQHVRLYGGYKKSFEMLQTGAYAYGGSQWNGGYYDLGAAAWINLFHQNIVSLHCTANPHYDSDEGIKLCLKAGITVRIIDDIKIVAHYSSIPEYRMKEHRVRVGAIFGNGRLKVSPVLSIPIEEEIRNTRALVSFMYYFK